MRIGMFIRDFTSLRNWEIRLIDEIRKDPQFELALLIQDGRSKDKSGLIDKISKLFSTKNLVARVLFKIQYMVESRIFRSPAYGNRSDTIGFLSGLPLIKLSPTRKGFLDVFSQEDALLVKKYDLDIILRHEFNIIRGEILMAAKHGIWSFHHGDNSINRGGPPGFWEIVLKQPVIGVTLQQLTRELDGGNVLDKGYYNVSWSYVKNNRFILDQSVSLLLKNLNRLKNNELNVRKSDVYYNPLYTNPGFSFVFSYIVSFYSKLFKRVYKEFVQNAFGVRYFCWSLFVGKGNFMEATLYRLKPIKPAKGEFWADPFLCEWNGQDYVFFENFSYKKKKGKISCGRLEDNRLTDIIDVLELDCHLSYPFIVKEGEDIFMIPETCGSKKVQVYKAVEFPLKWELYSTGFEGESIVDTTYYKDTSGQKWLFMNKSVLGHDNSSELYIYAIDSLKLANVMPHKQNPVIIDSRVARNAGSVFLSEGKVIRPSQNNSKGIYGYGLNLNEIKKLTLDEYVEEKIISVEPNFKKGMIAIHHLHQVNDKFIIDGAYARM